MRDRPNGRTRAVLAIAVILITAGVVAAVLVRGADASTPGAQMLLGGLLSSLSTVLGYYFGSSSSSEEKTDIIARMGR